MDTTTATVDLAYLAALAARPRLDGLAGSPEHTHTELCHNCPL